MAMPTSMMPVYTKIAMKNFLVVSNSNWLGRTIVK